MALAQQNLVARYGRLFGVQVRMSAVTAMQYRGDFLVRGFVTALWMTVTLIPFFVVFGARDQVAGWSLVGYGVISGLLLWVFIRDDIPSDVMTLLTASLVIFAVNIPLLFGFSVARYQPVE